MQHAHHRRARIRPKSPLIRAPFGLSITSCALLVITACGGGDAQDESDAGGSGFTWSSGGATGSGGNGTSGGDATTGADATGDEDSIDVIDDCLDDEEYFEEKVMREVLARRCEVCHNPSGAAKDSNLVLVGSWWGPTYLEKNREVVTEIARNERDGTSLLMLKPLAEIDHEGAKQMERGDEAFVIFEEFIRRIDQPNSHGCPDDDDANLAKAFESVAIESERKTLRKAATSMLGRLPSEAEVDKAEQGEAQLEQVLRSYMQGEAFYEWLTIIFNDMLLTDRYLPNDDAIGLLDSADYPNRDFYNDIEDNDLRNQTRRYANEAVAREAVQLMVHVVRKNKPFTEILTADYALVNPYSAQVYGVAPTFVDRSDPKEFVEVNLPGVPHAGVLSSSMFHNRFPTTDTNRNRHRSRMVYSFFLGTNVLTLGDRPIDTASIEDHNPTMNNPNCSICHSIIDPLAGTLANWDDRGRFRPRDEGWYPDMRPPGFNDKVMPSTAKNAGARWLADQIVADRRFAISMVQMAYRAILGRDPLTIPTDPESESYAFELAAHKLQSKIFAAIADRFVEDDYDFRTALVGLMASPYFRASDDSQLTGTSERVFDDIGGARFLSPELLDRKLSAVTGYPWKDSPDGTSYLTSTRWFRIYYGGIDSDTVVQRITEPNGLMASVANRMAHEMSCWTVPRDFTLPANERRLLPFVEMGYVPEDENGFEIPSAVSAIRNNLVHLYRRVLGEEYSPNDPAIDIAYQLFVEVWRDGVAGIEDQSYGNGLPWNCQANRDFWTGDDLPEEERVNQDPEYTARAWMVVTTYLLSDYRFLYD